MEAIQNKTTNKIVGIKKCRLGNYMLLYHCNLYI